MLNINPSQRPRWAFSGDVALDQNQPDLYRVQSRR
ncbi:hypothetical protein [Antarctobacter heliothermus]